MLIDAKPKQSPILLSVDGGVCVENIASIRAMGADCVVCGSALFGADDLAAQFNALMNASHLKLL